MRAAADAALETTLKIEVGADMVEIPLPPGVAGGIKP
jgi:hypothetical protein